MHDHKLESYSYSYKKKYLARKITYEKYILIKD